MPDITDSHIHLWSPDTIVPPWLSEAPALNRTFGIREWREAAGESPAFRFARAVYVEIDAAPEDRARENDLALAMADDLQNPVAGVVVAAGLGEGNVADVLAPVLGRKGLKGVRQVLHMPVNPRGACLEPVFLENLVRLGDLKLSFDACMRPDELCDLAEAARAAPETTIILDHAGNPGAALFAEGPEAPGLARWREGFAELARLPNVFCKISGLELPETQTLAQMQGAFDFLADNFGGDRVLYASNFPVNRLGTPTRPFVDFLLNVTAARGTAWQNKFFGGNAARAYRLDA